MNIFFYQFNRLATTMQDFQKLFDNHSIKNSQKKYKETFQILRTSFKERMMQILKDRKKSNRGRPCSVDWDKFFDCMFSIYEVENLIL